MTSTWTAARISSAGEAIPAAQPPRGHVLHGPREVQRLGREAFALLSSEDLDERARGPDQDVDPAHLVVPRGEVPLGARECPARRALAAELDQLAEQDRGLRAVQAAEVAGASEVLDLDLEARVRERARLQLRRFARAQLVGFGGELRVAEQRGGERSVQGQDARRIGRCSGLRCARRRGRLEGGEPLAHRIRRRGLRPRTERRLSPKVARPAHRRRAMQRMRIRPLVRSCERAPAQRASGRGDAASQRRRTTVRRRSGRCARASPLERCNALTPQGKGGAKAAVTASAA